MSSSVVDMWIRIEEGPYRVPFTKRVDVEESEDLVGFEKLEGGDVACVAQAQARGQQGFSKSLGGITG